MVRLVANVLLSCFCACEVSLACGATPLTNGTKGDAAVFTHATLDRAWQSTVENQRPLLVLFTSDNCAYCVKMVRETYRHPSVERLLTGRTEGVLAHASDNQALVSRLGIRGYPTSMLVSPRGEVLMVVEGFLDAEAFAQRVGPLLNPQARATVPTNSGVAIRAVSQ